MTTITIDGVTQDASTYTINGSQIEFNSDKSAPATATIDTGTAYIDVIGTTPAIAIDGTSTL